MLKFDRRAFGAALAAFAILGAAAPAVAQNARDAGAEAFVQKGAERVLGVLRDGGSTEAQKVAAFRRVIDEVADVPKITTFVLGKYARTITPPQKAQFSQTFRTYAESVYRDRLDEYGGETVRVVGSTVRKPGDVIVSTQVTGGRLKQPEPVAWRVIRGQAGWKVVDVQFKGVWLAITQQQDFVSTIDNAGGDVDVLIARLKRDVQRPAKR